MPRRFRRLIATAMAAALLFAGHAHAHRLEADFRVLVGRRVQVEGWFDLTGESPVGANVRVWRSDGRLLAEGQMDDKGSYVFAFDEADELKVQVSAAGHAKEFRIPKEALRGPGASAEAPAPFADRSARVGVADVAAGVGFILALASFVLAVRNSRRLRELERKVRGLPIDHQTRGEG